MSSRSESLLAVRGLSKRFPVDWDWRGRSTSWLWAVDFVDLDLYAGETLAVVGESGCGKSTLARLILRLLPANSGSVRLERLDVLAATGQELLTVRRRIQLVFQDPNGSLDPRKPVAAILNEGVARLGLPEQERHARAREALEFVGLPSNSMERLPHEFSGGERQRIAIARALVVKPSVLVLDEPVSALDPSVQALVLNLLSDLQRELGLTYLFISHDLSVVRHIADRVAVMYLGQIAECAPTEALFQQPRHPYTQALLSAIPSNGSGARIVLRGEPGSAVDPPQACRFSGRCQRAGDRCSTEVPALVSDTTNASRTCACFHPISPTSLAQQVNPSAAPANDPGRPERPLQGRAASRRRVWQGAFAYLGLRLGRAALVLIAASLVVVAGLAATPSSDYLSAGDSSNLGLNQPFVAHYVVFMKNLFTGNLGVSSASGAPISHIIATAGLNTLKLGLTALFLVYVLAIPLGVLAAQRQGKHSDQLVRLIALVGMGLPNFFLGALLIQYISLDLHWLPDAGPGGLRHLVLPAVALALESLAINIRLTRSAVLDELRKDYIRALQARGLTSRRLLWLHALRNALPPVVAYAGTLVPLILGYTIVIEIVFRFEGLGYELVESIINHDFLLAQTLALMFAVVVVVCNLLADLSQLLLVPQMRDRIRST